MARGRGRNWLSVFVFRMRWEHLSFAVCFVFDTIMLELEPDNSTQSLECKFVGIKTSHSDHLVSFVFFFFFSSLFFFLIGVRGRLLCPKREGVCTKDLETLWKFITSSEMAFSHTPDLLDEYKKMKWFLGIKPFLLICYFFQCSVYLKNCYCGIIFWQNTFVKQNFWLHGSWSPSMFWWN